MGKKSSQAAMKTPTKLEKKQQSQSLMKILRPKVYITDSSKFKNLVQELTGNGNGSGNSSPPPRINSAASPPPPFLDHAYHENFDVSFDSSCFSTPAEGSPDLRPLDSLEYGGLDLSSQIVDLESLLMGINSMNYSNGFDSCSAPMIQQEVCAYDYDFSSFIW